MTTITLPKRKPFQNIDDYMVVCRTAIPRNVWAELLENNGWRNMGRTDRKFSYYANLNVINSVETFTEYEALTILLTVLFSLGGLVQLDFYKPRWWDRFLWSSASRLRAA